MMWHVHHRQACPRGTALAALPGARRSRHSLHTHALKCPACLITTAKPFPCCLLPHPVQVKQYGEGLRPHKPQLQAAAGLTKSFMTKSALAAVAKL